MELETDLDKFITKGGSDKPSDALHVCGMMFGTTLDSIIVLAVGDVAWGCGIKRNGREYYPRYSTGVMGGMGSGHSSTRRALKQLQEEERHVLNTTGDMNCRVIQQDWNCFDARIKKTDHAVLSNICLD